MRHLRPKIFFEEWAEPTISGIRWVSELIELCGGDDVFAHTRARHDAKGRFVSVDDVVAADPDGIIASWCGKKVKRSPFPARYLSTTAVRQDQLYEIPLELILQPGPAALTDGVRALSRIIAAIARGSPRDRARPTTTNAAAATSRSDLDAALMWTAAALAPP